MDQLLEEALLYDFYGELLTSHQKEIYEDFVLNDLSLGEIAADVGISRQAVHETITRAAARLNGMEASLGVAARFRRMEDGLESALQALKDKEYDRIGMEEEYVEYLGNKVVCHNIPIRPGRNTALICESAAINHRQKKMGYNAAQELYKRVQNSLAQRREEEDEE